ncbi:MAG TPA: hypothetical protein VFG12_06820 [Rhodopila sp.]|nr:hypothetical protein [Rhodopila sp.]
MATTFLVQGMVWRGNDTPIAILAAAPASVMIEFRLRRHRRPWQRAPAEASNVIVLEKYGT